MGSEIRDKRQETGDKRAERGGTHGVLRMLEDLDAQDGTLNTACCMVY
jgi:hypothetical protein